MNDIAILGYVFLVVVIAALIIHACRQMQKAKWTIAICYIEEYDDLIGIDC